MGRPSRSTSRPVRCDRADRRPRIRRPSHRRYEDRGNRMVAPYLSSVRTSLDLAFDNSFARLHPAFHQAVDPTPLESPRLLAFNPDAAHLVDLDPEFGTDPEA